jgi:hypothetical protein
MVLRSQPRKAGTGFVYPSAVESIHNTWFSGGSNSWPYQGLRTYGAISGVQERQLSWEVFIQIRGDLILLADHEAG